ncbi:polysaccharide lyase family protein [Chitinophaga sedimenti]|uniref:polysaccharide lyase family protein n=1 Tax=Chitinophaga sedimenti TaxID=2033606 RepID=UPI002005DCD8|nr:polysaccharide lyase family protein [Chitinophaga sedimenti]MCK7554073.1 polysaccharide lyase family protein [Chitinophaga sedimenti]
MQITRIFRLLFTGIPLLTLLPVHAQTTIWEIGRNDNSSKGMALAPNSYKDFLPKDFGWEDRFFLINHSTPQNDWPYVLPGPKDAWGGTSPTAGIRTHHANILFGLEATPPAGDYHLVIDLLGYQHVSPHGLKSPLTGQHTWKSYQQNQRKIPSPAI